MRSRRAALYSSSDIMPFLRSASRVVRVSWKSVRSCSFGGMVTEPGLVPAPDVEDVCESAGAATAADSAGSAGVADRAIVGTSASAATRETPLPVTSSLLWDGRVRTIAQIDIAIPEGALLPGRSASATLRQAGLSADRYQRSRERISQSIPTSTRTAKQARRRTATRASS